LDRDRRSSIQRPHSSLDDRIHIERPSAPEPPSLPATPEVSALIIPTTTTRHAEPSSPSAGISPLTLPSPLVSGFASLTAVALATNAQDPPSPTETTQSEAYETAESSFGEEDEDDTAFKSALGSENGDEDDAAFKSALGSENGDEEPRTPQLLPTPDADSESDVDTDAWSTPTPTLRTLELPPEDELTLEETPRAASKHASSQSHHTIETIRPESPEADNSAPSSSESDDESDGSDSSYGVYIEREDGPIYGADEMGEILLVPVEELWAGTRSLTEESGSEAEEEEESSSSHEAEPAKGRTPIQIILPPSEPADSIFNLSPSLPTPPAQLQTTLPTEPTPAPSTPIDSPSSEIAPDSIPPPPGLGPPVSQAFHQRLGSGSKFIEDLSLTPSGSEVDGPILKMEESKQPTLAPLSSEVSEVRLDEEHVADVSVESTSAPAELVSPPTIVQDAVPPLFTSGPLKVDKETQTEVNIEIFPQPQLRVEPPQVETALDAGAATPIEDTTFPSSELLLRPVEDLWASSSSDPNPSLILTPVELLWRPQPLPPGAAAPPSTDIEPVIPSIIDALRSAMALSPAGKSAMGSGTSVSGRSTPGGLPEIKESEEEEEEEDVAVSLGVVEVMDGKKSVEVSLLSGPLLEWDLNYFFVVEYYDDGWE